MNIEIYEHIGLLNDSSVLKHDILNLVRKSSHKLSMFIYDNTSLLYDYLAEREVVRAQLLLSWVGLSTVEEQKLIVAKCPETEKFLGFCIYSSFLDSNTKRKLDGASITMIAVSEDSRNNGVFGRMMKHIQNEYSSVTLTCSPELAELYKKYRFSVVNSFQTHVCMNFGSVPENGCLVSVDDEDVIKFPSVINKYKELVNIHGKKIMDETQSSWQRDFSNGVKFVDEYILKHHPEIA